MAKISKTTVDAAQADPAKPTFIWDDKLGGFGLKVTPKGVKTFVYQYRPAGSSQARRMKIARAEAVSADQARKLAQKMAADIVLHGADPAASKAAVKAELTVSDMLDRFIAEHVSANNKARTQREEIRLIERLLKPNLGKLKVSQLTRARVKTWHSGTKAKVSANRALAHLRRACRFAIEYGWLEENPCRDITRNKETAKDRSFTDDELTRIGDALSAFEAEGKITSAIADGIRLVALTGMRASEARGLQWTDFDDVQRVLRLADAKAGARAVPLFPEAVSLLSGMDRIGPYIIAGAVPTKAAKDRYFSRSMERVLERAGVKDASLHTLRHTLATFMAQNGADAFLIARQGGWLTLAMVQRYVTKGSVGDRHPLPAGQRIAIALSGGAGKVVALSVAA